MPALSVLYGPRQCSRVLLGSSAGTLRYGMSSWRCCIKVRPTFDRALNERLHFFACLIAGAKTGVGYSLTRHNYVVVGNVFGCAEIIPK